MFGAAPFARRDQRLSLAVIRGRARLVAIAGLLSSVICVAILHVVRTDLPPVSHRLSEYANGPFGWMMTVAFAALGCGLLALGVALWEGSGRVSSRRFASATAIVSGMGMIVSGAFNTGVDRASEVVHSRASATATVSLVVLAVAYSWPLARNRPSAGLDPLAVGLALIAGAFALASPVLHGTRWTGLSQRLLWFSLVAWSLRAAWQRSAR
jgi:Protein of unknown function (DUF998)